MYSCCIYNCSSRSVYLCIYCCYWKFGKLWMRYTMISYLATKWYCSFHSFYIMTFYTTTHYKKCSLCTIFFKYIKYLISVYWRTVIIGNCYHRSIWINSWSFRWKSCIFFHYWYCYCINMSSNSCSTCCFSILYPISPWTILKNLSINVVIFCKLPI